MATGGRRRIVVVTRDWMQSGIVVGRGRACREVGCSGWTVPVRWTDGRVTRSCTVDMRALDDWTWKIS